MKFTKKIKFILIAAIILGFLNLAPVLATDKVTDKNSFEVTVLPRPENTEKVTIDFEIDADGQTTRIDKNTEFTIDGDVTRGLLQDGKNVALDAWKNHIVQPTPPSKARGTIQEDVGSDNVKYPVRQKISTTKTTTTKNNPKTQSTTKTTKVETSVLENNGETQERPLADKREFLTFETATGKVFHLIVDREKDVEQVKLVTEVSEQDLLNMIEIPQVQPAPISKFEKEVEKEIIETPKETKETTKSQTDWIFYILAGLVVFACAYGYRIYNQKSNMPKTLDEEEVEEQDLKK